MNHLADESSPYLLQHRDNPVDWYPWGDEAFAVAREKDRPIFLSIGYATCHWCHVMEHESFDDSEVASLMNESFVAIKVDREERPDIDNIYMTVCQLMGGHCGWPLNVVLTPDLKPFFVATYLPRTSRHGRIGMLDLLPRIAGAWVDRREDVVVTANEVTGALESLGSRGSESVGHDAGWLTIARDQLGERYDPRHGGFGGAPKFPSPHNLLFLLRYARRTDDNEVFGWVANTLRNMRFGGIFDQIGYGFHRYSTDESWTLPHFEKMLYDQALHMLTYAEAYLATGEELFRQTALQIADYVHRDLTSEDGAFFSAEDADSEGVEGKFYVWSTDDVRRTLASTDAERMIRVLKMQEEGNFREEATGQSTGHNIPQLAAMDEAFALREDDGLEAARLQMLSERERRPRPLLDDKVLADWNGLMIAALAFAGRVLGESSLVRVAADAGRFVMNVMYSQEEGLLHRFRKGSVGIRGYLDDYSFLAWGFVELYQATLDTAHLEHAIVLMNDAIDSFWDLDQGGFYLADAKQQDLLIRPKDFNDGAIPSGNAIGLLNLIRLSRITGITRYDELASSLLDAAAPNVVRYPSAFCGLLLGLEFLQEPSETVLAGGREDPQLRSIHEWLNKQYLPGNVMVRADPSEEAIAELAPYLASYRPRADGAPLVYVCRNYVCAAPAASESEILQRFEDLA